MTERGQAPSIWRDPLLAALTVTAVAHVPVTPGHLAEAPYVGVLFLLLEVACVGLVVLILRAEVRWRFLGAALLGLGAIAALLVSRTVGLPLMADDIGNWSDPLATISLVAESVLVVAGLGGAFAPRFAAEARPARLGSAIGAAVVFVGGLAGTILLAGSAVTMG
ncbi:MAG: hypothetical protein ACTHJL_01480 [Amnibacterium sp.]